MASIHIMALRHSAFYAPLLVTINGGYLQKQGLKPVYTIASPNNTIEQNLLSANVQLAQSAPAVSFTALEQGRPVDIVHFAAINNRDGFYLTARDVTADFQWSDLEGREVLVDHLFQPYATLNYAMFLNNARFDKIKIIDAGNVQQMDQAFRQGRGAYVHQQGPSPQQLEKDGLGQIVASVGEAIGPLAFSSLCATRDWLQTDMAQTFLHAYQQAMLDVIDQPAQAIAKTIKPFLPDTDRDVLIRTIDDYKQLNTWQADIAINEESYNNLLKVFLHSGYITTAHPMESCVISVQR